MKLFKNFMCMYIIKKHMRIYIYIYIYMYVEIVLINISIPQLDLQTKILSFAPREQGLLASNFFSATAPIRAVPRIYLAKIILSP